MISRNSYSNSPPMRLRLSIHRSVVFGSLIVMALLAFEIFNFSTTEFALRDILGGLRFAGITWATILAIAFCGIDFAGLARMFTPEVGVEEPREVWYLFGAWMLAAMMNAMLTWWGVAIAINNHETLGNGIIARRTLLQVVPVFVAIMVWLIRVLIIGTFTISGERLFGNTTHISDISRTPRMKSWQTIPQTHSARSLAKRPINSRLTTPSQRSERSARPVVAQRSTQGSLSIPYHPAPRNPQSSSLDRESENEPAYISSDPVYVPVGMSDHSNGGVNKVRI